MNPDFFSSYIRILFLVTFGMIAVPFLVVGVRGFKIRRPFLISSKWPFVGVILFLISLILMFVVFLPFSTVSHPLFLTSFASLAISASVFSMMVYKIGYVAFGVAYTPFRKVLMETLDKLQLPYEELFSVGTWRPALSNRRHIHLSSIEADLLMSTALGVICIDVKQKQHYPLLTEISNAMNKHFYTSSVRPSMIPFAFYLLMAVGVFTAVMAIAVSFSF